MLIILGQKILLFRTHHLWNSTTELILQCVAVHNVSVVNFFYLFETFHFTPSLNTQSYIRRPLCSTFRFENLRISPKKRVFYVFGVKKKIKKNITSFYVTFKCGRYNVFEKLKKKKLTLKTWKNHPKKLLIIGPDPFFLYWPGCLNGPKTEIPYHQKFPIADLGI
jgi:hypothetical protein